MKRIVYLINDADHRETFAWTRELAELTYCKLTVVTEKEASETEKVLSNQQVSRLLIYYYQHCCHPGIKGNSPDAGAWSDTSLLEQTLKFPEILFAGAMFKELTHLLNEKEDFLVLHPQIFRNYSVPASIINTKIPVIILPEKIGFGRLKRAFTGKNYHAEKARLFYHTLRKADKHRLPKDLYERLGRDTRIFNMIAAYFRKKFSKKGDR